MVHGENCSGVTSVQNRFVNKSFSETRATIGFKCAVVSTVVDGNPIKAQVWDTGISLCRSKFAPGLWYLLLWL